MGGQQGRGVRGINIEGEEGERAFYNLSIVPSKAVFTPSTEDITGQVILDLRKPFTRPGIIVISLDGKEQFEYYPFTNIKNSQQNILQS